MGRGGRRGRWVNRKPQKAVFVSFSGFEWSDPVVFFFSPHQYIFGTEPVNTLILMKIQKASEVPCRSGYPLALFF